MYLGLPHTRPTVHVTRLCKRWPNPDPEWKHARQGRSKPAGVSAPSERILSSLSRCRALLNTALMIPVHVSEAERAQDPGPASLWMESTDLAYLQQEMNILDLQIPSIEPHIGQDQS